MTNEKTRREAARHSEPDRASEQQVLEARAAALARPIEAPEARVTTEVVTFRLGRERYAVGTALLREVTRLPAPVPVPGLPPHFLGVINHRGEILAVADLSLLYGLPRLRTADRRCLLVLGRDHPELGFAVGEPSSDRIILSELRSPGGALGGSRDEVLGVRGDGLVVLDAQAILDDERLFVSGNSS